MKNTLLYRTPLQGYVLGALLSAAALLASEMSTNAQTPGSLDVSFDGDGKACFDYTVNAYGYAMDIHSDGKIVVAGTTSTLIDDREFAVVRLLYSGAPDPTFSGNGQRLIDVASGDDIGTDVKFLADGSILIAGYTVDDFALVKLNPDGSNASTFGTNGVVTTHINGETDAARAIAIQPDGKIVVVGQTIDAGVADFAVARYLDNGILDTSFGNAGIVTTDFFGDSDWATCVAIQVDGKILVGGEILIGSTYQFGIIRYLSNGSLDTDFSGDGKLNFSVGSTSQDSRCEDITLQPDGSIILAGYVVTPAGRDFALARLLPNGALDNSFGNGGKIITVISSEHDRILATKWLGYGKFIVAGTTGPDPNSDFVIARYNANGSLDNSFSSNGWTSTDFGTDTDDFAWGVAVDTNLNLVVAGSSNVNAADSDMAVARYLSGLEVGTVELGMTATQLHIYPNPIQESATLSYTLAQSEQLTIALQDLQGRVLATYLNGKDMPAGEHTQTITMPEGLASGNYLLVFSSPKGRMSVQVSK